MRKLKLIATAYLYQMAIAADQLFNAATGGHADETLSSRIYRHSTFTVPARRRWEIAMKVVNRIFFWQKNHCRAAYENEKRRKHFPQHFKEQPSCTAESN